MHLFGIKHELDAHVNIPVSWYVYIPVCVCVHRKYLRICKYTGMCLHIHAYSPQTCNVYAHTHSNSSIEQNKRQNVGTDLSECKSCTTIEWNFPHTFFLYFLHSIFATRMSCRVSLLFPHSANGHRVRTWQKQSWFSQTRDIYALLINSRDCDRTCKSGEKAVADFFSFREHLLWIIQGGDGLAAEINLHANDLWTMVWPCRAWSQKDTDSLN